MRALIAVLGVAAAMLSASAAAEAHYHVVAQLPAGDGGWDILSVDPVDRRLYIGRPDGVTRSRRGTTTSPR